MHLTQSLCAEINLYQLFDLYKTLKILRVYSYKSKNQIRVKSVLVKRFWVISTTESIQPYQLAGLIDV